MLLNVQCEGQQDGQDGGDAGRAAEEAICGPRAGGAEATGAA